MEEVQAETVDQLAEAKKLLDIDKENRLKQALREVDEVLKKYNCDLQAVVQISAK